MPTLKDGTLDFASYSKESFLVESLGWNNSRLIVVTSDDPTSLFAQCAQDLVDINFDNSRDLRVYNYEEDTLIYKQIAKYDVPQHFDGVFKYYWKELFSDGEDAPQYENDLLVFEFLRKQAMLDDYIAVVFIKINNRINSLSSNAVEIVLDYKYQRFYGDDNEYHVDLIRREQVSKYYIYLDETNLFYDFRNFGE